ncbi:adherens junction formation factor afadin isoform X3 [Colletes latitarsis]|uniref:adherens junction formation factor afadin isoform X3 n=1 Tax=Colletes latitarsis TaxID=2605962 RepID=UPI0040367D34
MTVSEEMATELASKKAEREALRGVIQQWNANRLDLFELSEPNEDLEFHGVMRFYFQDSGQKVATKCIRVASDATSQAVIETLIEKFRPDMRMLSVPEYALYEIHENGEERKLRLDEKPLLVQLNWHIDDREGRFLLRRIDDKTNAQGVGFSCSDGSSFRRKLSKREKKQMKKQEKLSRLKSLEQDENAVPVDQNGVAEKLYTELPETSFTRSISNPEAVMRRRRQQKLERKLQQFRSKDGGPDTGGTLKIYGEALCKDVPYKTLLLSVRDSAVQVVREMLSKYGLEKVDPQQYCLVQVNSEHVSGGTQQEYILDDDECPLAILMNHPSARGSIMFHVRRRPADYVPRKRKKKPSGKWNEFDHRYEDERLPFLLELNPDGSDVPNGAGIRHRLQPNVTEVGSERPIGPQAVQAQTLTLTGPMVMPRHCVIAFTENIVTLTPCSRDAHTYVNNQRIHQTTILQNGAIVKFGRLHTFRFIDPAPEERIRQRHDSGRQIEYGYDRRSPDLTNQETNAERYGSASGTPNGGQVQVQGQGQPGQDQPSHPSSPSKSAASGSAAVCLARSPNHAPESTHNYETTFDLDGNVETASLTSSRDGNRTLQNDRQPRGTDPILPAVLEFLEETEETFFHAVITDVEPSAPQFKLAPTYTLYLAARYRASTHYRPELQPTERAHRLTVMLANVAGMIQRVIQERYMDASSLALWLANGSELLHMLKNDRHVGAFSTRAQDILTEAVHAAFASLVRCISLELAPAMSQFMADADEPAKEAGVLQIFSSTMALLRRCRVNAALTIQLFSHLFHTINATAFNALVSNTNLCVRWFGRRLKARLNALETWAERQGLELASQCHLATIMQATHLLQAPKYNAEELATLSSTCFKLNSLQVRALLQKYQPAADEPRLPAELIENVVKVAESVADTLARADGREIRLEEEPTLALALLLPEDGYSCEVIRGVPPGLAEFLAPLQRDGLCRMAPQPTSSGYWTIYMIDHHNNFRSPSAMSNRSGGYSCHTGPSSAQPEIHVIKLHKSTNGMGLSIVAAKGAGQDRLGIYIKSVVAGGAADADGRLTAGDQLLKVDGQSLVGITQEKAAEYLVRTGPVVTLEVAKQGAIYHGLATLLSQPSPVMTRAHKVRPKSEHLEASKVQEANEQPSTSHSMGNLLTVPRHAIDSVRSIDPVPSDHGSIVGRNEAILVQRVCPSREEEASLRTALCSSLGTLPASTRGHSYVPLNNPRCWTDRLPPSDTNVQQTCPQIQVANNDHTSTVTTSDIVRDANESSTVESKLDSFSLDSIPYIDQTDDTWLDESNDSINDHRIGTATTISRSCSIESLRRLDVEVDRVREPTMTTKQQPFEQETSRRKTRDTVLADTDLTLEKLEIETPTSTSSSLDGRESMECETREKNQAFNVSRVYTTIPELNLDLSGLDSDTSSDVSSFEKCWKSPEEVRLGCGRVAALARHFSKLGNAESIVLRSNTVRLGNDSRRFASEPNFVSPEVYETRPGHRFSVVGKEYLSELDLRMSTEEYARHGSAIEDMMTKRNEKSTSSKEKLSLSEQRQIIEQLEEMSNLDDAFVHPCSSCENIAASSDDVLYENLDHVPQWTMNVNEHSDVQDDYTEEKLFDARFPRQFSSSYPCLKKIDLLRDRENKIERRSQSSFADGEFSNANVNNPRQASDAKFYWVIHELKNSSSQDLRSCTQQNEDRISSETRPKSNNDQEECTIIPGDNSANDSTKYRQKSIDRTIYPRSNRTCLEVGSLLRPRRMSERDLPSRLGRDATAPQQQIHTSKSVPALHNVGTDGKQQHEVFNPGYSRASSSNSVTPPVTQPPSMTAINGTTSLRSRSSHNLHDPIRIGTLPPSGLVSRQQSSPNLNPGQTTASSNSSTTAIGTGSANILQSNEAERFYQNLSVYRNQDATAKQRYSPSQHSDERNPLQLQKSSRGSQNSLNRPGTFETSQPRDRPISAYVSQAQQQSYFGGQSQQQGNAAPPRSQSSRDIIRQEAKLQEMQEEVRRRELRGGVPIPPNQCRPTTYNIKSNMTQQSTNTVVRPTKSISSQPNFGSNTPVAVSSPTISTAGHAARQTTAANYGYMDSHYGPYVVQYGKSPPTHQHQHQHQYPHQHQHQHQLQPQPQLQSQHQHQHQHQNMQQQNLGHIQYNTQPSRGKNDSTRLQPNGMSLDYGRDQSGQEISRPYADQTRHFAAGSQYYLNGGSDVRSDQYISENGTNRTQTLPEGTASIQPNEIAPIRPVLPEDGFRESPPPPPPNTTHPLYNKQSDSRYTASMQDPPRGGYYPANGTAGTTLQPRQYQYSATNPWQREEREKEQALRREAARQWRDQQIAELSALPHRTSQQEEQLRALQLERDFQKRAEEVANQQDDEEESNDLDAESMQRVQGLLRPTTTQERGNLPEQHNPNLSRVNVASQSARGSHGVQSLGASMHSTSVTAHGVGTQQCSQSISNISLSQQENSGSHLSQNLQHEHTNQVQNTVGQIPMSSLIQLATSQKSCSLGIPQSIEDKEIQRRQDEIKRKQIEFDETLKRKEEEAKQQQIQHIYQQQQQQYLQQSQSHLKNQQVLHPSMLRLENLVINGPNAISTQNGNSDAPLPPERGSSYAVMSQQGALRTNSVNASNMMPLAHPQQSTSIKRVSFHDSNANPAEAMQRNVSTGNLSTPPSTTMDIIAEDPNNFINDAENLLASPKTPEGSGIPSTGSTPGVIGAQEVYKDPRQRRLAEKQKLQQNSQIGPVPEKLSFKEKMKMFAMETGEDGTPRDKVKISRAQREIDNIGNPTALNSNNNSTNNNNNIGSNTSIANNNSNNRN